MVFLPHTNTVILLEPYCGTITEPGLPVVIRIPVSRTRQINQTFIQCFHSRSQHLCKFIGTKESVYIRKQFNSDRTGLGHKDGRPFIVLGHRYGRHDVM